MIDIDKYEEMTWETPSDELEDAVENLLAEVKRLNKVVTMLKKNGLWVSQEGWEESDKDDELLVSINYLIQASLELRGDLND